MSTTDSRAAFEAWAKTHPEGVYYTNHYGCFGNVMQVTYDMKAEAAWQAATEAAKATGTAGELPELPIPAEIHGWPKPPTGQPLYSFDQMREYGQACAEAARSLAISQADYNRDMDELAQDFEPVANMDLLKAKLHIVGLRKRLKNAKAKAEAARQPAPVVAVKTWQERQQEHFAAEMFSMKDDADFMELEIADLRAALAATAAPVAATQHPDDIAVDKFAVAMKDKMAASRTKGRGGWENPEECGIEDLACMLVQHVEKGDPVDIGNFCMMVWNRVRDTGPDTYAPIVEAFLSYARDTAKPAPATLPPVVGVSRDADSPGMTGVLVTFARPLSDGQLRELHEYLNRSQP